MEKDFKKVIREIKQDNMDTEKIKKYILLIKTALDKETQSCEGEASEREVLEELLKEYKKELEFRGNTDEIYYKMLQYRAYKELLSAYKGNKTRFGSIVKEAKRRESQRGIGQQDKLTLSKDIYDCMVTAVRDILRTSPVINERNMMAIVQQTKSRMGKELKGRMIEIIQNSVSFLEEFGILDEYINESNDELKTLGLQELEFKKRNPIPEEQYDKEGNLEKNKEDIGVIDSLSKEYLEQLSPEDLSIMTTFWESKYLEERLQISKAMSTINSLELWDKILHSNRSSIENLDEERISAALKRDLALTYLCRNKGEITPKIRRQYAKFLKENDMDKKENLEEEIKNTTPEITNLESAANDIAILQCLITQQLQSKDIIIKNWGVINLPEDEKEPGGIQIAIEHQGFRGPLLMEVSEDILKRFLGTDTLDLPKYKNTDAIDENYSNIMSKLYLPSNEYFREKIKEAYEKNPSSVLFASLAGKKVKKTEESAR